jgi:hypothetical protein
MPVKQRQHRPGTRAPHGCPQFTERVAAYVTPKQKRAFTKLGGSGWLRSLIDRELMLDRLMKKGPPK